MSYRSTLGPRPAVARKIICSSAEKEMLPVLKNFCCWCWGNFSSFFPLLRMTVAGAMPESEDWPKHSQWVPSVTRPLSNDASILPQPAVVLPSMLVSWAPAAWGVKRRGHWPVAFRKRGVEHAVKVNSQLFMTRGRLNNTACVETRLSWKPESIATVAATGGIWFHMFLQKTTGVTAYLPQPPLLLLEDEAQPRSSRPWLKFEKFMKTFFKWINLRTFAHGMRLLKYKRCSCKKSP